MTAELRNKIDEFKKSLNCVEGFFAVQEVVERGRLHIVLATTQAPSTIVDYCTPSCAPIVKFANHFGLWVGVFPFADTKGRGVAYDIVVRGTKDGGMRLRME